MYAIILQAAVYIVYTYVYAYMYTYVYVNMYTHIPNYSQQGSRNKIKKTRREPSIVIQHLHKNYFWKCLVRD